MAFTPLSRYPDNPQAVRKPDLEIWHTALVRAVNGVLGVNGTGGVWTVGNGSGAAGVTLDSSAITEAQSSIVNIQGFPSGDSVVGFGAYWNGSAWVATAASAVLLVGSGGVATLTANTGLTAGVAFTPTTVWQAQSSGVMTIPFGQVAFPATQNPSSNANTLDDYEEGAWTPVDASGAGLTFTTPEGYYVKIGQFVLASAFVVYPATASGAAASIGGAPFTSRTTTNNTNAGSVGYSNSGLALGAVLANNGTTTTFANFATGINVTNVQLTGTTLVFANHYRAAA